MVIANISLLLELFEHYNLPMEAREYAAQHTGDTFKNEWQKCPNANWLVDLCYEIGIDSKKLIMSCCKICKILAQKR